MDKILLSQYSKALIENLKEIDMIKDDDEGPKITVSKTVSFLAIVYEKVRNAVEFRDEHLIRRAAIERILKRRLALNPAGAGEAENLIRELLWARYLSTEAAGQRHVERIQKIIDSYLYLRLSSFKILKPRRDAIDFINDLLTCEVEENLNQKISSRKMAYLYYFYQVLKNKVDIKGISDEDKDLYFYVASEAAFAKSDNSYLRYHLFRLKYDELSNMKRAEIEKISTEFVRICKDIDKYIANPFHDKLSRFAKKHRASFLILFDITEKFSQTTEEILKDKGSLWKRVDEICSLRYAETGKKLARAAVRSIIYIFLTKMIFVFMLEYPLTKYFYGKIDLFPLLVNTLFPPVFMGIIVSLVRVPSQANTKRIYQRIIDILNRDPSFETAKTLVSAKPKVRRPLLLFGFSIFYIITFGITFASIYFFLDFIRFNFISKFIFVFFISLITFFGYRIRQTSKEYNLEDRPGILAPLSDFFFLPILSLGKFLSSEIAKLNIFIWLFDILIEAPFKLLFEIVEEWINFIRGKKEEIV